MDEEKLAILKEKALKCKVIALDILQHNPLSNPSNMNPREKKKVIKMMETWFEKKTVRLTKSSMILSIIKFCITPAIYLHYLVKRFILGKK